MLLLYLNTTSIGLLYANSELNWELRNTDSIYEGVSREIQRQWESKTMTLEETKPLTPTATQPDFQSDKYKISHWSPIYLSSRCLVHHIQLLRKNCKLFQEARKQSEESKQALATDSESFDLSLCRLRISSMGITRETTRNVNSWILP